MADTGIFATTAEVARKAGDNVSTTSIAEAYVNDFMTQAESEINDATMVPTRQINSLRAFIQDALSQRRVCPFLF